MKIWFTLALLFVIGGLVLASGSPKQLQMAYAMQRAVLRDQDLGTIESLLKAGVLPSQPIGCGRFDSFDGAVNVANPKIVQLLLKYGGKPRPDTVVHAAFINNEDASLDIMKQFLAANADVNSVEHYSLDPKMAWSALDQAVWRQHTAVVGLLLAQKGIRVNVVDGDGETPLMIAVEKGDQSIVQALLVAGADPRWPTPRHENAFTVSDHQIQNQHVIQSLLGARTTASN